MTRGGGADLDRLAVLVHELRSPVAALGAVAGAAAADDEELPTLVALAGAACRAIERLVSDATSDSVLLEEMDAGLLAHEAVAAAVVGGARVRAEVQPGLPRVQADPLRLRQALDNLVSNALVHGPPDGEVVVAARSDRASVLLSVTDAGAGIPVEEQARIFDAGVRLDPRRPGEGLGLAITRSIVEAHGGTLSVESREGHGATFTIALPSC